jgi:hypothetical protein
MPGSRRRRRTLAGAAALLCACATALGAGACNELRCTRTSECDVGFVCTRDALCEPAPDASPSADGGAGPVDAGAPDAGARDGGPADASPDAGQGDGGADDPFPFDLDAGVD